MVNLSAGGMIHLRDGANSQYVTGTAFLFVIYSDVLKRTHQTVNCGSYHIKPSRLMQFAKQQVRLTSSNFNRNCTISPLQILLFYSQLHSSHRL